MGPAARIRLFLNTRAGSAGIDTEQLRRTLQSAWTAQDGEPPVLEVCDVAPERLQQEIRHRVDAGDAVVAVGGGDGTLNSAATVLAGTGTALLCVPLGTLNNFARRLHIESVEDAAGALRAGNVQAMAVGTVADRVFLNTLTFGEYARIVRLRDRMKRWTGKWPAAMIAFIIVLSSLRRFTVTLDSDEGQITRRTPFVWVGIGWGSFPRVHEAPERRRHPVLEVAVARASGRAAAAAFVFRVAVSMLRDRAPVRDRDLEVLHTRTLTVAAAHRLDGTADGEVVRLAARVDIGVRDEALRVLANGRQGRAQGQG